MGFVHSIPILFLIFVTFNLLGERIKPTLQSLRTHRRQAKGISTLTSLSRKIQRMSGGTVVL